MIELCLGEHVFPVRVVAFEEAVEQQCDCCCEKGVEFDGISEAKVAADKNHKSTEMLETRDSSRVEESLRKASAEETVVPNSVSHGVDSVEMVERMWEGNKREDWRVLELPSVSRNWSNEEEAGMVHRFDNSLPNNDGLKEIYIQEKVGREGLGNIVPFETYSDVSSPVQRGVVGSKAECPRAKIATATILNNGQVKRVPQVSEINLSFLTPTTRAVAENNVPKRGKGRPKKSQRQRVANESLSDSDILNRKRVILKEARETVNLGKLIGATTLGNKEVIVKDIARIIEAREKKL
ncbi:hypothetical protein V6N13_100327 [Hibiscus sabdariffa]